MQYKTRIEERRQVRNGIAMLGNQTGDTLINWLEIRLEGC